MRKRAKFDAKAVNHSGFLLERDREAISHLWKSFVERKATDPEGIKAELKTFVAAFGCVFEECISKAEFTAMSEVIDILDTLNPQLKKAELDQLRHVLQKERVRECLDIDLKPGALEALQIVVKQKFHDYVQANPDDEALQWYYRDANEQLSGIAQDLPIDEY